MSSESLKRSRTAGAFTLVEILAVLVIIGIASAVVVPRISNMGDMQVASAARTLSANMQYAQNEAIVSQRSITIAFDPANAAYDLRFSDGTVLTHPVTKDPFRVSFSDTPGAESVTIVAASFNGASSVTFDPLGAPDNNGEVTLLAGGFSQKITVAPVTGRLTIEDVTP